MQDYDDEHPEDFGSKAMTFNVEISNFQQDFFTNEIAHQLADRVTSGMRREIEDTANELIHKKLHEQMEATIADVIEKGMNTPIQPSDNFSNPKGGVITMSDFIAQGAEKYLETTTNDRGVPEKRSSYNRVETRLNRFLAQVITNDIDNEIRKQVATITTEIRNQMKSAAAEWLAKFQAETVAGVEKAKALASRI